ncbi:MAG TPA: hydrogen gas-evolving membrane-bound hydrogenase subunit E [Thermoanaerobaculia bacterium]|nr:hydrogen gas-evolving membrane-bound hydrogenase subunit E [Thermoanaerobaculia bacterium]
MAVTRASGAAAPVPPWVRAVPLIPLALFIAFAARIASVASGAVWTFSAPWAPSLGLALTFRLDGLALLFALLITGVGVLITAFATSYLAGDPRLGRFQLFLLLFMGSMLGVTTADNAILLFIFWELTSISSFLLIGFDHQRKEARDAALEALLVTSGGGLALLAGLVMLGRAGGSFEISEIASVSGHPLYMPIVVTVALGCFTKSAQTPFHFWLPSAMEAPTPVSAYLHSATMVKAGVYLLARLAPALGGTATWTLLLGITGGVTMLTGSFLALRARDLKRILAYSTVAALGMLVLLLGVGTREAAVAAVLFLLAHALYKASLFLMAGTIEYDAGSRNVDELGGLGRAMPLAAVVTGVGALGLAGFGPILAFIAKETMLGSLLAAPTGAIAVTALLLASAMLTAVAVTIGWRLFWGESLRAPSGGAIRESKSLIAAPLLLAIASVAFAIVPAWAAAIVAPAASSVTGVWAALELHLWHGPGMPLLLSAGSLLGGLAIHFGLRRFDLAAATEGFVSRGPQRWYGWSITALVDGSARFSRLLQSGYLRSYVKIILVTVIALVASTMVKSGIAPTRQDWDEVRFHEVVIALVIMMAALVAVRSESRLGAVAALGVVGYGVALMFITFSAPDLAMTQFLVETLMVILFVQVIYHLPRFVRISPARTRAIDACISIAVGAIMTVFVIIAANESVPNDAARFFAEASYREAYGRNMVNVILVDFRALDTAGEITVLAIAAVGVYALLKIRGEAPGT